MTNIHRDQADLKQVDSHNYTANYHNDWTIGPSLHGGCVAAVIQLAASKHFSTTLSKYNQPDILALHFDYLRLCTLDVIEIKVIDLKLGKGTCTIQLHLSQDGKLKVLATATSTNFDTEFGPSCKTEWSFLPSPTVNPDFEAILAHRPEPNWVAGRVAGEIGPFSGRVLNIIPRNGWPVAGTHDAWATFLEPERIDLTYLTLLCDLMPSMSDTLLKNGALYDGHLYLSKLNAWAEANPGAPAAVKNTLEEAMYEQSFNSTITLDIEFKRRLPKDGLQWVFNRTTVKKLENGRMDVDMVICDEKLEPICLARQIILVLDAKRRFGGGKETKSNL